MVFRREQDSLNALTVEASEIDGAIDDPINQADNPEFLLDMPLDTARLEKVNGEAGSNGNRPNQGEAVDKFFDLAVEELTRLRTQAEVESIERAAALIIDGEACGGRVHVTGIGKSEHVARYLASLLSSTGTPAYFLHATECVHGSAGQVRDSDVAIAISNSGTTPELMTAVSVLRGMGIKIIGVSGNRDSALARASDVFLHAGVENEGGMLNLVPRASILAKIYVLCGLSVSLEAHKGLTREQYARWHPGGVLGKKARGDFE